jgi:HEAT repeat protein
MVSDYADGQRPKRGRGRIYHIAYVADAKPVIPQPSSDPLAMLDSDSYIVRCDAQATIERAGEQGLKTLTGALAAGRIGPRGRLHAIWILVHAQGARAIEPLFAIARSDPDPPVRAQAVRAIADLADPMLARHRLDAGPGDPELAARLAELGKGQDSRVGLEIMVALGRLRWRGTADWLKDNLTKPDAALAHATMQALRQSGNWPALLNLLDAPDSDPLRGIALRAVAGQFDAGLVDGLVERLSREKDSGRVREYADSLARVHKKPGPWVYWDYRPKPRPANPVSWERTEAIAAALNRLLSHIDPEVRLAVLKRMQREKVPASLEALGDWLKEEPDPARVTALLGFLRDQPAADVHQHLEPVIRNPLHSSANRLAALALFVQGIDEEHADALCALCEGLEDGPVLAETLRLVGKYPKLVAAPLLARKLDSAQPEVRAAAIETLGELRAAEGRDPLVLLLADQDAQVRRAAASAAGKLQERRAIEPLLKLAADSDPLVRVASLGSLRLLKEPRAVPLAVAALGVRPTEQIALESLRDLGGPEQADAVAELAKRNPSLEVLTAAVQVLTTWRDRSGTTASQRQELDRAVAEIHGSSGTLVRWNVSGPAGMAPDVHVSSEGLADSRTQFAAGTEGRIVISAKGAQKGNWFQARADIAVLEQTGVEFLASSSGNLRFSLNDKIGRAHV